MKKTQSKTIFKFAGSKFSDPFQMIATLFDSASPDYYKSFVKEVILYSSLNTAYYHKSTSSMLFLRQNIKQFIKLAYAIYKAGYKSPLKIDDTQLFDTGYYVASKQKQHSWLLRPLVLTAAEYKNPYLVFETVFEKENYKSLYTQFNALFECACTNNPILETQSNELSTYIILYKIIEACYLIDVREVLHIGGWLKSAP